MANNSNRKAIEFMVQGALPPHSTNVLWMDTSVPTLPVLKIFENGAWTTVHTEQSKIDALLAKTVFEQSKIIDELTNGLDTKVDELSGNINTLQQTVAKESNATINKNAIINALLNRINEFDEKITPYLYDECSVEDIDRMFSPITEDGYIIVPSSIIRQDGTIPLNLFVSITGLTPVLNDDEHPVGPIIDENGRIVLPASAFSSDGTMSISLFQQLTGLRLV